ncbi:MAG: hypothetical protein HQ515_19110 [Phycisphaeraceae bacterium]|nr:hypothetical protein [Phycisphaeraceae bacterium]
MEQEKRPGGLTALAIFNFIFAGFGVIGFIGIIVMRLVPIDKIPPEQRAPYEAFQTMGILLFVGLLVLTLVSLGLELVSGIGYLKQKRGMGWMVGNIYAVLSVVSGLVSGLVMEPELGGGFSIGAILNFVYPVLTLILLNSTFKEDFTN